MGGVPRDAEKRLATGHAHLVTGSGILWGMIFIAREKKRKLHVFSLVRGSLAVLSGKR